MNVLQVFFRKIVSFVLVFGLCITGFKTFTVKAAESEIATENNDDLETLIMKKNHMKYSLRKMDDSPEKEALQAEYDSLCTYLTTKGVNDCITENLEWRSEDAMSTYQVSAPDLNGLLGSYFDLDTYYSSVSIDGTVYSLYRVIVTDKDGYNHLSYVDPKTVVLKGSVKDETAHVRFARSVVTFTSHLLADSIIDNSFLGAAVSALIDAIPDYDPSYVIHNTANNILTAHSINVDEAVMYIYVYNKDKDLWMHVCSRNSAFVAYTVTLSYKDSFGTKNKSLDYEALLIPDKGGKSNEDLVRHMFSMVKYPGLYTLLDNVAKNFSMSLGNSDDFKTSVKFHGNADPYFLYSN